MNTKLLRQKILDLAIRGKLTDQRKSDGTAGDLLTQISDERRKTRDERIGMSSKKNGVILEASADRIQEKTSLRAKRGNPSPKTIIPLDKGEVPFEIPDNWEWVRLGDVASLCLGKMLDKSKNKGTYCRYLRNVNIRWGEFDFSDIAEMKFEDVADNRFLIKYGDLVMCEGGEPGRCAVWTDSDTIHFQKALHRIRFFNGFIPKFYQYLFFFYANKKILDNYFTGSTIKHLTGESLREIPIPLPPLAEQQRIVAKIEEAFAEVDAVEKNKELLKTHIKQTRQKILDLAIHGKLVPQDKADGSARELLSAILSEAQSAKSKDLKHSGKPTADNPHYEKMADVPFEIPDSWEWVKLGDVGKWQSGTTPSKSDSSYYKDGTIPWLNTGDLNDGIIREIPKKVTEKALAETSLRLNKAGSVCIAMYGATIGKIGILSMPATTNQACCVCNNLKNFVNQMWLFYFLKNHKQEFIEAGFGGAQPNISKEKITATLFPLPPLAEQKRIVDKIEEVFASLDEISLHLV